MKKPKGDYAIQTVVNAMRLLEAFRDEEELGVTEQSTKKLLAPEPIDEAPRAVRNPGPDAAAA